VDGVSILFRRRRLESLAYDSDSIYLFAREYKYPNNDIKGGMVPARRGLKVSHRAMVIILVIILCSQKT
jgi:hypothetical protein